MKSPIRKATEADQERCCALLDGFYAASPFAPIMYEPASVANMTADVLRNDDCAFLLSEETDTFGLYLIGKPPWAVTKKTVYEIAQRGDGEILSLLAAAEAWAREKGACLLYTGAAEGFRDPSAVYRRKGFRQFETVWAKELT